MTSCVLLADLTLAEGVYLLQPFYEVERGRVAELMRAAITLPRMETLDANLLLRAFAVYEIDRIDFAEAHLVAQAEATGVTEIASFDRSLGGHCRTKGAVDAYADRSGHRTAHLLA